jgi:ribosomal protein L32
MREEGEEVVISCGLLARQDPNRTHHILGDFNGSFAYTAMDGNPPQYPLSFAASHTGENVLPSSSGVRQCPSFTTNAPSSASPPKCRENGSDRLNLPLMSKKTHCGVVFMQHCVCQSVERLKFEPSTDASETVVLALRQNNGTVAPYNGHCCRSAKTPV